MPPSKADNGSKRYGIEIFSTVMPVSCLYSTERLSTVGRFPPWIWQTMEPTGKEKLKGLAARSRLVNAGGDGSDIKVVNV